MSVHPEKNVSSYPLSSAVIYHKECDTVVAVLSSRDTRIERIIARDDIDKDAAELRTHAQRPDEFYIKRADFIIKNNNGKDELEAKAAELLRALGL